jgi:ATP-dependent Clp protease ATP-binding subunit ClpC
MRSIVAKELSQVLQRRGLRNREWAVEWEPSALEFLLDKGFSHAMGARPLKRAIDQHLLAPLAATLVEHRFPEGDQFLFVRSDGRALQVEFVDPDADDTPVAELEPDPATWSASLSLSRLILHPAGTDAERVALMAEQNRLELRLESEPWIQAEGELASRLQRPDFWDTPDRPSVLARFEVIDRIRAALASSRSLAGRLDRSASVSGRYSKDLIARLASQLLMIDYGIDDALTGAPVDVMLSVQPVMDHATDTDAGAQWRERLFEMYRRWSARRGMQLEEVNRSTGALSALVVSGFGAARLLAGEAGLHVLDYEDGDDSRRAIARIVICEVPLQLPEAPHDRQRILLQELERGAVSSTVVRRYRDGASPVVRDLRAGWRTGHADLVFDGQFDLIGAVWPGAAERA